MSVLRTLPLFPVAAETERGRDTEHTRKKTPRPAVAPREPPRAEPLQRATARRLWLAVHLPQLAFEALQDSEPGAVAVIDPLSRQQVVLACSDKARAAGVRAGQSLNAAIALEPDLEARPRAEEREHTRLVHLAAWCQQQFTPLVSLAPPDELLLEVTGSLKLFGGAQALLERIAVGLRAQGVTARLALAPTPTASLWLARSLGSSRRPDATTSAATVIEKPGELARHLANVGIGWLRWPQEVSALLLSMGLRTVGDLVRLPRAGFARRVGTRWLEELDRALARRMEPRRAFRSPERFDARLLPEHEIEAAGKLEAACAPLLERLQRFLLERQAAIAVLACDFKHRAHPTTRLRLGLALPSGDVAHLQGLLAERLRALALPAPVIAIRLLSGTLLPALPTNGWLMKPGQSEISTAALPRLLERLRARLGNEQVFGVCAVEDHRPELAWKIRRGAETPAKTRASLQRAVERPLWLLAQPHRIRQQGKRLRGPERIETGWWDGNEVTRDYFDVRAADGARLWVYRERRAPHDWYVHGIFG
ncbi:MAG TPA: DNA polymerase Y family protein [Steroidobacteraceae bacterium]|nr:DNA polymerase Y family protein [Steroidobacteraceae bacterium]